MHISDMLGQYNRNISSGTEELKAASGMQKVVSTLEELSSGSVFEGTVSSVKNGKVTLALSDGQTITARLSGKVPLSQGTPMFFQVKSNDGATIEIKPYTGAGSGGNPILTNALTEGTVPVTERNLAMVDAMMKEQMPIDKQSLLNMARIANMNPGVDITTVVNMTKLGIPVSPEMAAQFENYMTDEHAILQEMDQAMNELADLAGSQRFDTGSGGTDESEDSLNPSSRADCCRRTGQYRGADRNRWTDNGRRADRDRRTDNGRRTDRDRWTDNGRRTDCDRRTDNGGRTDFD